MAMMGVPVVAILHYLFASSVPDIPSTTAAEGFDLLLKIAHINTPSTPITLAENRFGTRGVFCTNGLNVSPNDELLSVPLASCITCWADGTPDDCGDMDWMCSLIETFYNMQRDSGNNDNVFTAWSALLPDPTEPRQILPVHWSAKTLEATDSQLIKSRANQENEKRAKMMHKLRYLTHEEDRLIPSCRGIVDIYELVMTRTCQVQSEEGQNGYVLAPAFDMINHASHGYNNASYMLEKTREGYCLVVRAKRELEEREEILIDYGEGTRDLECLHSYGFLLPELESGAEVVTPSGSTHVLNRRTCPHGVGMALLKEATDAVRESKGLAPLKDDNQSLVMSEAEAVWIIERIDEAIRRSNNMAMIYGTDFAGSIEVASAANVRTKIGGLLQRCRQELLATRVKNPFLKARMTLLKPT